MRRLIIDRLISEKGCVTFQELQDVLKASSPTIKRDIRYMREQLGAPITYSRADGGYRYSTFESSKTDAPVRTSARRAGSKVGNAPLDFLRKLWYSSTELLVLKTTVDLLELLACDKTSAIFSELEPLRSRVVSLFSLGDTLPRELLRRVKVVRNNKFFVESRAFETIGCALSSRHRAKIRYYTPSRDEETDREISPLRLVHYRNRWYVDAYCHRAEELRTFRIENIRRIAEVGKLFVETGIITLAAFISPNNDMRRMAAEIIGKDDFLEVYISTPIEECEKRDVKGLYAKARRGEIKEFTGVSAPFEVPEHPAISLDTSKIPLEESVNRLLELILPKAKL